MWRRWWWGVGEKKNRVLSIEVFRSVKALPRSAGRVCFFFLVVFCVAARDARGISSALFERPRDRALGLDQTGASLWRAPLPGAAGTSCRFEAGEWLLHGIGGLRTHSAVVEVGTASWDVRVSAAVLGTPVGREAAIATGVCAAFGERIRLGTTAAWETADLDGCERAHLLVLSVSALLHLSGRAALVTRASNIRLAGEPLPGAGASIDLVLAPESPVCAVARFEVSPAGAASFGVASRIALGSRVRLCLGYDDDTGSLDGSIWMRIGGVGLDAGSSFHPVLGVSQGLFVSWGRGW
jgi:hypothetical protein